MSMLSKAQIDAIGRVVAGQQTAALLRWPDGSWWKVRMAGGNVRLHPAQRSDIMGLQEDGGEGVVDVAPLLPL